MTKRETIALHYWYERQPQARAAMWNIRHSQQPVWLKRKFAGYVSWKFMGGPAPWHQKLLTFFFFWFTVALYRLKRV